MPKHGTTMARVCVAVLIPGWILCADTARAQNALVKVTPLGSHSGELCADDRALLFEDPNGVRILYDPGFTTDETDPRLGDVHVVLLSHAHIDHVGANRANRGGGTCAAPARGAANAASNLATITATKNAALFVTSELTTFMGLKIQGVRGVATSACPTSGFDNETTVPTASPCTAAFGPGATRSVKRGGTPASVQIIGMQAVHPNSIPAALLDPPGQPGVTGYGGVAMGFVVKFTNGLVAYLTGDTGVFGDMGQVISKFYKPNLMVINIGPGGLGPTSLGALDAANVIRDLVRPKTVMPSHVQEQATSGGAVRSGTWTEAFVRSVRDFTSTVLPISDVTLTFDGEGRCIGCPQ